MNLLRIIHLRKGPVVPQGDLLPGSFVIDSCLRKLWVCDEQFLREQGVPFALEQAELLSGEEAYTFLLRVACGLESQIVGETDIFGQVKEAWKGAGSIDSRLRQFLSPWMQRLFEDTKEIRSLYLQNTGGASYGSLVRMILARQPEDTRGPVLLVGAGQLAKSVAPYLLETELWIANRSREPLARLHHDLIQRSCAEERIHIIEGENALEKAWLTAAQVVLCVPPSAQDERRISLWKKGGAKRPVIHLGALAEHAGHWHSLPCFYSLTDVFALESSQGRLRSTQIARARKACDEKAKLRLLGGSASLPHGWEDLAIFA
jgi:hypothetical protein